MKSIADNRFTRIIAGIMKCCTDAWDCHQPARGFVFTSEMPDLPIKRLNQTPKRMASVPKPFAGTVTELQAIFLQHGPGLVFELATDLDKF